MNRFIPKVRESRRPCKFDSKLGKCPFNDKCRYVHTDDVPSDSPNCQWPYGGECKIRKQKIRYALLECEHVFCFPHIANYRKTYRAPIQGLTQEELEQKREETRSCPICNTYSRTALPCRVLPSTEGDRKEILALCEEYCSFIDCPNYKFDAEEGQGFGCAYGDQKCPYRHRKPDNSIDTSDPPADVTEEENVFEDLLEHFKKRCDFYYYFGKCSFGESCWFKHEKFPLARTRECQWTCAEHPLNETELYGLMKCTHAYCLKHIIDYRKNHCNIANTRSPKEVEEARKRIKSCPLCCEYNEIIVPSMVWPNSDEQRKKIEKLYKIFCSHARCKRYKFNAETGKGFGCPYGGEKCLYRHVRPDGSVDKEDLPDKPDFSSDYLQSDEDFASIFDDASSTDVPMSDDDFNELENDEDLNMALAESYRDGGRPEEPAHQALNSDRDSDYE